MSKVLRNAIIFWIGSFVIVSFIHAYVLHIEINELENFHSPFSDVISVGLILSALSLLFSSIIFFLTIRLVKRTTKVHASFVRMNTVLGSLFALSVVFGTNLTASFFEGIIFVGSYFIPLIATLNYYFFRLERT